MLDMYCICVCVYVSRLWYMRQRDYWDTFIVTFSTDQTNLIRCECIHLFLCFSDFICTFTSNVPGMTK